MSYSFEHGIDHVGRLGIAPIFVVGGPIQERDFEERDLENVASVIVVERGIPAKLSWEELSLKTLFSKIESLKYLSVDFEKKCNLDDIGSRWNLEFADLHVPEAKMNGDGFFNSCQRLKIRAPTKVVEKVTECQIEKLDLIRPLFPD